ncbi:MAG: ATP-dependent 6-phosphofructokinase [Firmicutes bacterium]|nr:ATP-dependent 6-phosphofructokinase [Bacillota bacterium]
MKRIGFMTGGGDCAGINAFLAACLKRGSEGYGAEFVGIRRAFEGACADRIEDFLVPLGPADAVGLENKPSTILESSRFNPFSEANRAKGYPEKLVANLKKVGIDAVLATGGNDTIKSTKGLTELGIPAIAAPKSIDNDVSGTDTMLGFKTAVTFGASAFRSTVESARTHRRISLVEIMGREAGWLSLEIGLAGGADIILIPEKPVDLARLCGRVAALNERQGYVNIAVAEGTRIRLDDPVLVAAAEATPVVAAMLKEDLGKDEHGNPKLGGIAQILRRIIRHRLGLKKLEDVRATDLGFTLRGLPPVADDIILGLRFGFAAVDLLFAGEAGFMVGLQGTRIVKVPFAEALVQKKVDWSETDLKNAGVVW